MEKEQINHIGEYLAKVFCNNCAKELQIWIRKGLLIMQKECPNCDCKTLSKSTSDHTVTF